MDSGSTTTKDTDAAYLVPDDTNLLSREIFPADAINVACLDILHIAGACTCASVQKHPVTPSINVVT